MRELLKRLLKLATGYGIVQWAGPFISLILTPILTRYLQPSDYGVADYILTAASAVGTLAMLAMPQAMFAIFHDQPEDSSWSWTVTASGLLIIAVSGSLAGLCFAIFAPAVIASALQSDAYTPYIQGIGVTLPIGLIGGILTASAQASLRVRWGMLLGVTSLVATIACNLLFIVILPMRAAGMLMSAIASGVLLNLVALIVVRSMIGQPNPKVIRLLLQSGLILLPMILSGWILQTVDRFFLIRYVSTTELGYYTIANRIAGLIGIAMGPLYNAWTPLALSIKNEDPAHNQYALMGRYLIGGALLVSLGLGLFSTEILLVLTRPAYLPASPYVGFLTYIYVLSTIGTVLSTGALAGKQLKNWSFTVFIGALLNIILNFLLIPTYGIWGATVATVIGYSAPQVLLYLFLQKHYPIPYPIYKILTVLFIHVVLMIGGTFVPPLSFPLRITLKFLIFSILPIAYLWVGMITPFEIQQLRQLIQRRMPILPRLK